MKDFWKSLYNLDENGFKRLGGRKSYKCPLIYLKQKFDFFAYGNQINMIFMDAAADNDCSNQKSHFPKTQFKLQSFIIRQEK